MEYSGDLTTPARQLSDSDLRVELEILDIELGATSVVEQAFRLLEQTGNVDEVIAALEVYRRRLRDRMNQLDTEIMRHRRER